VTAAELREREERLKSMVTGEIPEEFSVRSRETAADIVSAHITGKAFIDVGNVPNIGQVSNLPWMVMSHAGHSSSLTTISPPQTAHVVGCL
jgi:alpha-galactosidase/6-phospho-beta-glucosidase family protein